MSAADKVVPPEGSFWDKHADLNLAPDHRQLYCLPTPCHAPFVRGGHKREHRKGGKCLSGESDCSLNFSGNSDEASSRLPAVNESTKNRGRCSGGGAACTPRRSEIYR
jgi:hypothetical protein